MHRATWYIEDYYNSLKTFSFGWCARKDCSYRNEHEYKFDGQVFYKEK